MDNNKITRIIMNPDDASPDNKNPHKPLIMKIGKDGLVSFIEEDKKE